MHVAVLDTLFQKLPSDERLLMAYITALAYTYVYQGSRASWKVLDFFFKIPGPEKSWKITGPGKSWKLKFKVLESPRKISLKITHFLLVQKTNQQRLGLAKKLTVLPRPSARFPVHRIIGMA